jgi:hypothetical protein
LTEPSRAVFLSYASQDAGAAQRICEALRAAGIEVWFDKSELRGGDVWDRSIRQQIRECALFVPLISTHTDARPEGYFRATAMRVSCSSSSTPLSCATRTIRASPRFAARSACRCRERLPRANPPSLIVRRAVAYRSPSVRYRKSRQAGPGRARTVQERKCNSLESLCLTAMVPGHLCLRSSHLPLISHRQAEAFLRSVTWLLAGQETMRSMSRSTRPSRTAYGELKADCRKVTLSVSVQTVVRKYRRRAELQYPACAFASPAKRVTIGTPPTSPDTTAAVARTANCASSNLL